MLSTLILVLSTICSNVLTDPRGSHVLTGLRKVFLLALTHVPGNKGTLGTLQIKVEVQASPGRSHGRAALHVHSSLYLGQADN